MYIDFCCKCNWFRDIVPLDFIFCFNIVFDGHHVFTSFSILSFALRYNIKLGFLPQISSKSFDIAEIRVYFFIMENHLNGFSISSFALYLCHSIYALYWHTHKRSFNSNVDETVFFSSLNRMNKKKLVAIRFYN